jgi:hypothetical protein
MNNNSRLEWLPLRIEDEIEIYELWSGLKKLMVFTINHREHIARIESENSRRNFHIDKEGFLLNKTILKNEYGVRIGQISHELLFKNEGIVELNEERFSYSIQNNPLTELIIYKKSKKEPLLVCSLKTKNENTFVHFSKNEENTSSLLMALCWFLFLPVAKENMAAFAVEA